MQRKKHNYAYNTQFFAFLIILLFSSTESYAYVDPGSGHFLLQLIVAFLLGSLFYVRKIWTWFSKPWNQNRKTKSKMLPPKEETYREV